VVKQAAAKPAGPTKTAPNRQATAPEAAEPVPAGEVMVLWARPQRPSQGVHIHAAPSRSATALGSMRTPTAIAVKPQGAGKTLGGGGCRAWLQALPEGYLCRDEVELKPGYLSDPPPQEQATAWRRFRYGVVKTESATLENPTGEPAAGAGFLRGQLHKGDGVTVIREQAERVQVYGSKWLRKGDVALVPPPALEPVDLQALPPAQRYMVAWAVPALGETQVPIHPVDGPLARTLVASTGGAATVKPSPLFIPRYSQLWWTDGKSSPGRIKVYLSEETRTALFPQPEKRELARSAAFEIEASQLRRVTQTMRPLEVAEDERWIDISLSEQVAVAYAGDKPLFAALVSTGKGTTPPGSFFIYRKYLTQTMANLRGAASQYDFREVPWAQFFNGRIGLHAVLWHDLLGHPVSHGCVNMSPVTAEKFFGFTSPEMPAGWHAVNGQSPTAPLKSFRGTRVVVRR
jgi:hypothetical protein